MSRPLPPRTGAKVPSPALWALLTDGDLDGDLAAALFFLDGEEVEAAWSGWRDEILREWVRQRPGTRPAAWWVIDAPRSTVRSPVVSVLTRVDIRATESEASYLLRHGLLLPGERRRLGDDAFAPIKGSRPGGLKVAADRGKWFCVLAVR